MATGNWLSGNNWMATMLRFRASDCTVDRLAISCAFCGKVARETEASEMVQIDHLFSRKTFAFSRKFSWLREDKVSVNDIRNLVPCCRACNIEKNERNVIQFLAEVSPARLGQNPAQVLDNIVSRVSQPLTDLELSEAKAHFTAWLARHPTSDYARRASAR